jgi:chromosome transmission fidelity protein 1
MDAADPAGNGRAGREYYQSICMRAVNQSIGRSIRHAGDYSSILLVDERYSKSTITSQLPRWIAQRLQCTSGFGEVVAGLRDFFKQRTAAAAAVAAAVGETN